MNLDKTVDTIVLDPEAAEALTGVPARYIKRLLRRRDLHPVRLGKKFGVTREELLAWVRAQAGQDKGTNLLP